MPPAPYNQIQEGKFGASQPVTKNRWLLLLVIIPGLIFPLAGGLVALFFLIRAAMLHKRSLYIMSAIAIAASLVGLGAIYAKDKLLNGGNPGSGYSYTSLDNYKLDSKLQGAAISFSKPKEITLIKNQTQQGSAVSWLAHSVKAESKYQRGLAYVTVSSVQSGLAASSAYLDTLGKAFTAGQGKDYETMIIPVTQFIKDSTSSDYNINLAKAAKFSNSNIAKNAWQFDFTASYKQKEGVAGFVGLKGKVLLVVGQRTFYYFLVDSVEYNWDSNQKIWQQVLDSIKVDQ